MADSGESILSPNARKYYRQMKAATTQAASTAIDIDALIKRANSDPTAPVATKSTGNTIKNAALKTIDILEQPLYVMMDQAEDRVTKGLKYAKDDQGGTVSKLLHGLLGASLPTNPLDDFGSGNNKLMPGDMLRGDANLANRVNENAGLGLPTQTEDNGPLAARKSDNLLEKGGKVAGSFIADMALDPLTYVTLGATGAATKAVGSGLARVGAEGLAEGVTKGGQALINFENRLTKLPGEALSKVLPKKTASVAAKEGEKVADDLLDAATPSAAKATETAAEPAPSTFNLSDLLERNTDLTSNRAVIETGGGRKLMPVDSLDPSTAIEYSEKAASKRVTKTLPADAIEHLRTEPNNTYKTPYELQEVAPEPKVETPQTAAAQITEDALVKPDAEITSAERKAWLDDPNNRATATVPAAPSGAAARTQITVQEAISRINSTTVTRSKDVLAHLRKAVVEAANNGVRQARRDAVAAAREGGEKAPALAGDSLEGQARTAVGDATARPLQVAQKGRDRVTRGWVARSPRARDAIRKRWKRALDEEDFRYLYDDYLKDPKLTDAAKNTEFRSRIAALRKGRKTDQPIYAEVFFDKQLSVVNRTLAFDRDTAISLAKPKGTPEEVAAAKALNKALTQIRKASEIIEATPKDLASEAAREDVRLFTGQALSPRIREIAQKWLGLGEEKKPGLAGQAWNGERPEGYNWTTRKQGSLRNSDKAGVGWAINSEAYNSAAQNNVARDLLSAIGREADEKGLKDFARSQYMLDTFQEEIIPLENFLRAHNAEPIFGTLKSGVPFSIGDAVNSLTKSKAGRDFLLRRVFGGMYGKGSVSLGTAKTNGTVYFNAIMQVFETVVDKLDVSAIQAAEQGLPVYEAIGDAVAKAIKSGKYDNGTIVDALTDYGKRPITTARKSYAKGAKELPSGGWSVSENDVQAIAKELSHVLFGNNDYRVLTEVAQRIQERSAAHGIQFRDTVAQLSRQTLNETMDFLSGQPSLGESIDLLGDIDRMVSRVAKTKTIRPTAEELSAAQARVSEDLGDVVSLWDAKQIKAYKNIASETTEAGVRKAATAILEAAAEQADDLPVELVALKDVVTMDTASVAQRVGNFVTDKFSINTVRDGVTGKLRESFVQGAVDTAGYANSALSANIAKALNRLNRTPTETLVAAYKGLQQGTLDKLAPELVEVGRQLDEINRMFFDKVVDSTGREGTSQLSNFMRNGYDIRHVRDIFERARFGMPEGASFDWDAIEAITDPSKRIAEMQTQWSKFNVKDPIDFLGRMSAITSNLSTRMSASQMAFKALSKDGLVSATYKPGMVLIKDMEHNNITRYWPTSTPYVNKHLVNDIVKASNAMDDVLSLRPGSLGSFMYEYFTAFQSIWKRGVTIYRPGFHIRNLIGDVWMSYLQDGVKNPKYYYSAMKLIGNRAKYDGIDMLRIVEGLPTRPGSLLGDGEKFTLHLGNKKVQLTYGDVYNELHTRGTYKTANQQADLIMDAAPPEPIQKLNRALSITGGRIGEGVRTASEGREDLVRTAHALHLLEHAPKSITDTEHLFDWVAKRVNFAHPDGTGLTSTEKNIRNILIPFYSWLRKSTPVITQAAMQHPGRILAVPKASYSLAQQNGIDVNSLSDPYPDDQLFPSWVTDSITGPVWQNSDGQYYTINPGFVDAEFIDDYMMSPSHALETTLDSISPLIKTAPELWMGKTLGTRIQTPGSAPAEYLGSQIPGISHVQSLTGVDVLGSVLNGQLQHTNAVDRGNRDALEPNQFINLLTGVGARNVSTPSTIRSAQIEQRDAAKGG